MSPESDYQLRKRFYRSVLTVYGRKPVLEALQDDSLLCHTLHLATSNKPARILDDIKALAEGRGATLQSHDKQALSRISRNGRQDQGVALDIRCPTFMELDEFLERSGDTSGPLLALDGVTNPQNLGMIVRSVVAAGCAGLLLPERGSASLGPLVIKASAGTLFRAPLLRCDRLDAGLRRCQSHGYEVCTLRADAKDSLFELTPDANRIFVLGNETEGVSADIEALAQYAVGIPMKNGVESLNVAVTGALIAYATALTQT